MSPRASAPNSKRPWEKEAQRKNPGLSTSQRTKKSEHGANPRPPSPQATQPPTGCESIEAAAWPPRYHARSQTPCTTTSYQHRAKSQTNQPTPPAAKTKPQARVEAHDKQSGCTSPPGCTAARCVAKTTGNTRLLCRCKLCLASPPTSWALISTVQNCPAARQVQQGAQVLGATACEREAGRKEVLCC